MGKINVVIDDNKYNSDEDDGMKFITELPNEKIFKEN
jgi:hypothetical protein